MRKLVAVFVSCLVGWVIGAETALAEGRLGRARREVEGSSRSESRSHSPRSESSSHSPRSESSSSSVRFVAPRRERHHDLHHYRPVDHSCIGCGTAVYAAPYSGYRDGDADELEPARLDLPPETYASYPYESSHSPYMLEPDLRAWTELYGQTGYYAPAPPGSIGQPWAGRIGLDGGYLLGIVHSNFGARLLTPSRFEFSVRGTLMYEPTHRDRAQLLSFELGVRVLQLGPVMLRLLAAAVNFDQSGFNQNGGELGIEADLFLGRPWVISLRGSGALVGEAIITNVRVQLGYLFERYEVYAAYQDLRIGDVNLSAPLIGMRVWL